MARKELGYVCYVIMADGSTKELEQLTADELSMLRRNTMDRLSRNMRDYYTQHPEEFKRLPG